VPVLEIIEGPAAGTTFDVIEPTDVGRDPSAAILIDDPEVSRRHARLSPSGQGILVEDLQSRNGTYVNEQPIYAPVEARPGDQIRFGMTVLALQGARAASGVLPVPDITQVGAQVLRPAAERELAVVPQEPAPPVLRVPETEPGYVPGGRAGNLPPVGANLGDLGIGGGVAPQDPEQGEQYRQVAALRDGRVKPQTRLVAFGFLVIAALAIIVYFGVTT
jgi:pSer/pThr/pTyr-binding forkhead associated (FHA) protein